jgi:periplasmic divalent cation tolerance protein
MQANVILCTVPTEEHAQQVARTLVEEHLAACVSIVPGLRSIYRWEDGICDDAELLLLIKTRRESFAELLRHLNELHPYAVPEVLALAVADGSPTYLDWLEGATAR